MTKLEELKLAHEQIREYIENGGLFNPELQDHGSVRDMILRLARTLPQLIAVAEDHDAMVAALTESYALILEAKHKFAPTTTNSLADDFIPKLKRLLDEQALAAAKGEV